MTFLELIKVRKEFGPSLAVEDFDLQVEVFHRGRICEHFADSDQFKKGHFFFLDMATR